MTIIVVDDSQDIRELMTKLLEADGHAGDVLTASSAQEAFDYLTMDDPNNVVSSVDLILMDINMPDLDG